MKSKTLTSAILTCIPLMLSVNCTATAKTASAAVNPSVSKSAKSSSDESKKQAIKAQEDAYKVKYKEQLNTHGGCDNGAVLTKPYTTEEEVKNGYMLSNYEYPDDENIITFKTVANDRFLIGDYNYTTKKADNYNLVAHVKNCAMFNHYDKTFATDNYGNKYKVGLEYEPRDYTMADEKGNSVTHYTEALRIPVSKEILTKYRDKGITFTLRAWGSPDGKTPRKFTQDIYVEPNIIKVALEVDEESISSTAIDFRQ